MTANGFNRPAPVLPAMGLHSFHDDSPPFGAAASVDQAPEAEYFALDTTSPTPLPHSRATSNQSNSSAGPGNAIRPTTAIEPITSPSTSLPIPQRGFQTAPLTDERFQSTDDETLSSSRSRRLVSGYLFGFPAGGGSAVGPERQPTPPIHDPDSPPLSDPVTTSGSPAHVPLSLPPDDDVLPGESTIQALARMSTQDLEYTIREGRKASRSRDRDTTYDVLNGYGDGEADLDESAPPPDGVGTEAYLRGEDGDDAQYRFPRHRLRMSMKDESKIPLVIVACGSFSPPTYLHLRMFEMAKDEILESQTYEIMAGYYSPVSSFYKKAGLAPAIPRVRMCELAVEHTSTWLMVDTWEAGQPEYKRTAVVLDHFDEMLNVVGGGVTMSDGKRRRFKIMLLAGGDLIESFGEPGVWSEPDLHVILGRFGCLIVERAGSDVWAFLLSHDILYHHRRNVIVIKQLIYNDISSTKVRLFVRRGMSIKYLLPNSVIQYIHDNQLYRQPDFKEIPR